MIKQQQQYYHNLKPEGVLEVTVYEVKHLKPSFLTGAPNPYVIENQRGEDFLYIAVIDFSKYIIDTPIGITEITLQDILNKYNNKNNSVEKHKFPISDYKKDHQINFKTDSNPFIILSFNFKPDFSEEQNREILIQTSSFFAKKDKNEKRKFILAEKTKYENCLLKIHLLSVQNCLQKEEKSGYIKINHTYQEMQDDENNFSSNEFTKEEEMIKQSLEFELYTKKKNGQDGQGKSVYKITKNLNDLQLFENHPKTYKIEFIKESENQQQVSLLIEFTVIKNQLTKNPKGIVQINVRNIELYNIQSAVFTYSINQQEIPFGLAGTIIYVETEEPLKFLNIKFYENQKLELAVQDLTTLKSRVEDGRQLIYLAELNWKKFKGEDKESDEYVKEFHAKGEFLFVGVKGQAKILLTFVMRNENIWTKQKGIIDKQVIENQQEELQLQKADKIIEKQQREIKKAEISQKEKENTAIQVNVPKQTYQPRLDYTSSEEEEQKAPLKQDIIKIKKLSEMETTENQTYENANSTILYLKKLSLRFMNFDAIKKTQLYFQITVDNTHQVYFTYVNEETDNYNWEIQMPIEITQKNLDSVLHFKLFDLNLFFDDYKDQEMVQMFPYPFAINELISFQINPRDLLFKNKTPGFCTIPLLEINKPYRNFLKTQISKNFNQYIEDIQLNCVLEVTYKEYESYFIDNPVGIFTINGVLGQNLSYNNFFNMDIFIHFSLNNQSSIIKEKTVSGRNPQLVQKVDFLTFDRQDNLQIQVYECNYQNQLRIINYQIKLNQLNIFNNNLQTKVLNLGQLNKQMTGILNIYYTYTPLNYSPFYQIPKSKNNVIPIPNEVFWGFQHRHFSNLDSCRIGLKIRLKEAQVHNLACNDKFKIEFKIQNKRFISTDICGQSESTYYVLNPFQEFTVYLNPHDEGDSLIIFSLITYSSQNFQQETTKHQCLFSWTNLKFVKNQKNNCVVKVEKQDTRSMDINLLYFDLELFDNNQVVSGKQYGVLYFFIEQLRQINFSVPRNCIPHLSIYLYVLRISNKQKDYSYIIQGSYQNMLPTKNVFWLPNNTYNDHSWQVIDFNDLVVYEGASSKQQYLTFREQCPFVISSIEDIFTIDIFLINDKDILDDQTKLDLKNIEDLSTAYIIYKGHILANEILNLLSKPQENSTFAIRMFRQNCPYLLVQDEFLNTRQSNLLEETYLILQANFQTLDVKGVEEIALDEKKKQSTDLVDALQDGVFSINLNKIYGQLQNSNPFEYGNIVDFRRVPKRVIGGDNSAPRTDFSQMDKIIEERSQINCNIYNSIFNETVHKIFNSTTVSQFTLSMCRLYAEKLNIPLGGKKNILSQSFLFRDNLQERFLDLNELQLKTNESLYMQYAVYKEEIQQCIIQFDMSLYQTKFTRQCCGKVNIERIELLGVSKQDLNPSYYIEITLQSFRNKYKNSVYMCESMKPVPTLVQVKHQDPDDHSLSIKFQKEFEEFQNGIYNNIAFTLSSNDFYDILQVQICDSQQPQQKSFFTFNYRLFQYDSKRKVLEFLIYGQFGTKIRPVLARVTFNYQNFQNEQSSSLPKLSLRMITRFKTQCQKQYEKIYKVIYHDSEMNKFQFESNFRRSMTNFVQLYVREEFKQMNKIDLNTLIVKGDKKYKKFKQFIPGNATKFLIDFQIPKGSTMQVVGSFKKKFNIYVGINILSSQGTKVESLTVLQDQFTYQEERNDDGDEIEYTTIQFMRDLDFYIDEQQLKQCKSCQIEFRYVNKQGKLCSEIGDINQSNLQVLYNMQEIDNLFEYQTTLVLIRPSNRRMFIQTRKISSYFIENPLGKLTVQLHRLVKVPDSEIKQCKATNQGHIIRYKNKTILVSEGAIQSQFAQCFLKLKLKINNQKAETQLLNSDGNLIDDSHSFFQADFLTGNPNNSLDFVLQLSGFNDQQSLKSNLPHDVLNSYLKSNKTINLCKGKINLSDLVYNMSQKENKFFFLTPLNPMVYHEGDVLQSLYKQIDREDIYALGSLQYEKMPWVNVIMKFVEVRRIKFNKNCSMFTTLIANDSNNFVKSFYMGMRVRSIAEYTNGSNETLKEYESPLTQFTLQDIFNDNYNHDGPDFLIKLDKEQDKMTNINIEYPHIENLIVCIELFCNFEGQEYGLCSRYYPMKKFSEPKYLNKMYTFDIDIDDKEINLKRNDMPILIEMDQNPMLRAEIIGLQEIMEPKANKFLQHLEEREKENLVLQKVYEQFDFRKMRLCDLIAKMLQTGISSVFQKIISEMHELFIYIDYKNYKKDFPLCLKIFIYCIRIYKDDEIIISDIVQNLFTLAAMDVKRSKEIFKQENMLEILSELAFELFKTQQPGEDEIEQCQKLFLYSENFFLSFPKKVTKQQLFQFTGDDLSASNYDISQIYNCLYYQRAQYLNSTEQQPQIETTEIKEARAKTVIYILKLLECYINKELKTSLDALQYMKLYNFMTYYFFDDTKNISPIFSMIISNYIYMTGFEEGYEKIDDAEFRDMLNTICKGKNIMTLEELPGVVTSAVKLFSYICFKDRKKNEQNPDRKDKGQVLLTICDRYLDMLLFTVRALHDNRLVRSQLLRDLNEDLDYIYNYEEGIVKDVIRDNKYIEMAEKILKEELVYVPSPEDKRKQLFNEDMIIEQIIKSLKQLAGFYFFEDSEFQKIEKYLKERIKTIKSMKRKACIEGFLTFLFSKNTTQASKAKTHAENLRRKAELKKKKTHLDTINQADLQTKYLVSRLEWDSKKK